VSVAQFLLDVRTPVPTVAPTTPVPDEEPPGTRFPFWIVLAALAVLVGLAVLVVLRIRNACIRAALR